MLGAYLHTYISKKLLRVLKLLTSQPSEIGLIFRFCQLVEQFRSGLSSGAFD